MHTQAYEDLISKLYRRKCPRETRAPEKLEESFGNRFVH